MSYLVDYSFFVPLKLCDINYLILSRLIFIALKDANVDQQIVGLVHQLVHSRQSIMYLIIGNKLWQMIKCNNCSNNNGQYSYVAFMWRVKKRELKHLHYCIEKEREKKINAF